MEEAGEPLLASSMGEMRAQNEMSSETDSSGDEDVLLTRGSRGARVVGVGVAVVPLATGTQRTSISTQGAAEAATERTPLLSVVSAGGTGGGSAFAGTGNIGRNAGGIGGRSAGGHGDGAGWETRRAGRERRRLLQSASLDVHVERGEGHARPLCGSFSTEADLSPLAGNSFAGSTNTLHEQHPVHTNQRTRGLHTTLL